MGAVLALLSALCFGTSDFVAGIVSRRLGSGPVAGAAQGIGFVVACVAVIFDGGAGLTAAALAWGALAGLGSAVGTLALYRGLAVGRMSVVATLSAVLAAVIPVIVGVALGNQLPALTVVGIILAVPAIVSISAQPTEGDQAASSGVGFGLLAGAAFALLLVALDQAGTGSGAWPLVADQFVAVLVVAPFALRGLRVTGRPERTAALMMLATGMLSGLANLLFLLATGHGELAVIAVLTSLYPAVTVVLARIILAEEWSRLQVAGLLTAGAAIVLVGLG